MYQRKMSLAKWYESSVAKSTLFSFTATVSTHKNILASVHISIHAIYHYNSQGFRPKAKQISRLFWLVFEIDK